MSNLTQSRAVTWSAFAVCIGFALAGVANGPPYSTEDMSIMVFDTVCASVWAIWMIDSEGGR